MDATTIKVTMYTGDTYFFWRGRLTCTFVELCIFLSKNKALSLLSIKFTLKISVVILTQNKHFLVTLFKHVYAVIFIKINMLKCLCYINAKSFNDLVTLFKHIITSLTPKVFIFLKTHCP